MNTSERIAAKQLAHTLKALDLIGCRVADLGAQCNRTLNEIDRLYKLLGSDKRAPKGF